MKLYYNLSKVVTLLCVMFVGLLNAQTITITNVNASAYCIGDAIDVSYSKTGSFTSGNIFSLELSDNTGSFTSPVVIGTLTSSVMGTINGTIPLSTLNGTQYKVRIVSSTPVVTSPNNGSDIVVNGADFLESDFGDEVWNVLAYDGNNFNTLKGSYVISSLDFDTRDQWASNSTPSSASGYVGCTVPNDQHSLIFKREGFPCGDYQIDIPGHDDYAYLFIDGVLEWSFLGCCTSHDNVWSGSLNENSTVEFRFREFGGGSYGALSFTSTSGGERITESYNCANGEKTLSVSDISSAVWSPSTGLNTTSGNSVISTHADTITYTVTGTNDCNGQSFSASVFVQPSHLLINENTFGDGYWHASAHASRTFGNYQGYFTTGDLSFNTNTIYSANTPSSADNYVGCDIPTTNHSVSFKRTNFDCGDYQIDVNNHDDEMSIYVDGFPVFVQNGWGNTIVDAWNGFLGTDSEVEIRYANGGGPGQLIITMTQLNSNVSTSISSDFDCLSGNNTITALNLENVTWTPSTGLTSTNTVQTVSNHNEEITYTVNGTSTCDGSAQSAMITIPASNKALNPDTYFGDEEWTVFVYNGNNFDTYDGYYIEPNLNFNTQDRWASNSTPTNASGFVGCGVGVNDHSYKYKRRSFDCGTYQIDIPSHDDDVSVYIDGVNVFTYVGCCTSHTNVWTGFLGPNSTVEITGREIFGGQSFLSAAFTKTSSTPAITILSSMDCATFENTLTASGGHDYVWSPSAGLNTTTGATVIATPIVATTYTVNGLSDCDNSPLSATVAVNASAVGTDPAIFGDNIWNVYSYDNRDFTDYHGFYTVDGYKPDTRDDWSANGSPSDHVDYRGCDIGINTHSVSHKRRGFPCGEYTIDIDRHDDEAELLVDGVQVWVNPNCCTTTPGVWVGQLDENSTVEFKYGEGPGESIGAFSLHSSVLDTTIWLGNSSNFSASSNWSNGVPNDMKTSRLSVVGIEPVITNDLEIGELILNNGVNLTVASNNTLTVAGSINVPSGNSDILGHVIMKEGGCENNVINALNPLDISVLEIDHATSIENIGAMVNVTDKLMFTKGNIKSNNNLTLISTQTKTAYLDKVGAGTITDHLTVQRWVGASLRKWWHLSTPVSNATAQDWQEEFPITGEFAGADFLDGNDNPSVKWYNETDPSSNFNDGWTDFPAVTNTEQIVTGRGYRVYLRENRSTPLLDTTIDLSGTPNMGSFTLPISYTVGDDALSAGWNFVGNPYPSAIDWNSGSWSKSNLQNAIYVWDALNSRYLTYVDGVGANGGTNQIASGQSFWVRAENTSASLQVTEDCKISDQVPLFRQESEVVYVNIENNGKKSNTALRFMDEANQTFDSELDAYYFGGSYPVNIGSYNDSWDYFSINSLPKEGEFDIPLYVYHKSIKNTTFTLSFDGVSSLDQGDYLTLTDVYKGITTEVTSDNFTYDFEYDGTNGSKGGSRFVLRKRVSAITSTEDGVGSHNTISVYPNRISSNESFSVLLNGETEGGELTIVNMQGQVVESIEFDSSMDVQNITPNLSSGFYTVVINVNGGVSTTKLVVE